MIDLLLALRNLLRNRRRTLATFLALVIGSSSILFFGGYRKNIEYSMLTAYVREGGHFQVQHRDLLHYGTGDPVRYSIAGHERLLSAIRDDPVLTALVTVATPTLQFGGIASNPASGASRTVFAMGIVAEDRNRMRAWNEHRLPMDAEPFALEATAQDAAVVGTGVARVLLLCDEMGLSHCPARAERIETRGDDLPADIAALALGTHGGQATPAGGPVRADLLASSAGGAPNVASLILVKAERQGFRELDEIYLSMHFSAAQRLVFGRETPRATAIMVQLKSTADMRVARERLQAVVTDFDSDQPLTVLDFAELNPFFVQTVQMFGTIFGFIFGLIAAIVLFTVGNTMSTAVMERTVEIGTIRAIGVRRRGVRRLFVLEGVLLGLAGAVVGVIAALAGAGIINRLGLSWLPPGSGDRLPLLLIVWGETSTIALTAAGLIMVAAASAWWPAHRASRLAIVDALRHA